MGKCTAIKKATYFLTYEKIIRAISKVIYFLWAGGGLGGVGCVGRGVERGVGQQTNIQPQMGSLFLMSSQPRRLYLVKCSMNYVTSNSTAC